MNKWRNGGSNHYDNNSIHSSMLMEMMESGGILIDYQQLLPFVLSPLSAATAAATSPTANLFIPSLFGTSSPGGGGAFLVNAVTTTAALSIPGASVPPQHRKLFIGGLNHETSDEQLLKFYSKWGHVVDCIVIRDPVTRQSRGFGFVTFATPEMADAAMVERPHTIGGKVVDPKRAIPREQMLQTVNCPPAFLDTEPPLECKLILSGIHWDFHTVDALRHHFEAFGDVEQVEIVGHPRGYGFVVFEERDAVERCLAHSAVHVINGRKIGVREKLENNKKLRHIAFEATLGGPHGATGGGGTSGGHRNESSSDEEEVYFQSTTTLNAPNSEPAQPLLPLECAIKKTPCDN